MDKVWLSQYPAGIPPEIDVGEYASLREVLERSCRRFATLPAFSNMGTTLTYGELDGLSRDFGAFLQHDLQMVKGDRLAIMLPNLLQYPVAFFGALRAGLVVVNVNPLYTAHELEHQLRDSGATAILVLENFAHTLEQVLAKTAIRHVITTRIGDLFSRPRRLLVNLTVKYLKRMVPAWSLPGAVRLTRALRLGRTQALIPVALDHDDVALLQYTGGTTGVAKGAVLSHRNLVANVLQLGTWVGLQLREGMETAVVPLPLYHIYALTSTLVFSKIGAHCVLITNPRDLPSFVSALKSVHATAFIGVNTLYNALLDAPGFSSIDFSQLRVCAAGGMAVQHTVAQRWKAATGAPLVEGYGLSETSPVLISNRLDIREWTGTIGLPLSSTEAAVLDEHGSPVPAGEVGEVCVRGPQVTKAYWNKPEETKQAFTADGWFRTGDMGVMDEQGYFRITDRKKDMIVVSGFKVFPNEVEDVAMLHPGVHEAGAVGIPDSRSGEVVKLVVVKKQPDLTEQALLDHCRKHLTGYKQPRVIEFRTEPLPKSPIGKILRRELRGAAPAQQASAA